MKRNSKPLFSAVKQLKQFAHKKLFRYLVATGLVMCVAHSDADSYTDTRYYITATLPDTYDAAGYASTDLVWTEIGLVTEFPPFGAMSEVNKLNPIYGAVKKVKRTPDYGGGPMVYGYVKADPGHIIVEAASLSQAHYSMKAVNADGEINYLDVLVTSCQKSKAASGEFQLVTAGIEINKPPVNVAAA